MGLDDGYAKRKYGFYWVMRNGKWVIAQCNHAPEVTTGNYWDDTWSVCSWRCVWYLPGIERSYSDCDFQEIHEDPITQVEDQYLHDLKTRIKGFYWVAHRSGDRRLVLYWNGDGWKRHGHKGLIKESYFGLVEGANLTGIEAAIIGQLDGTERPFIQMTGRSLRADFPEVYVLYFEGTKDMDYLKNVLTNIPKEYIKVLRL